jgi:hypothetical protein
VENMTPLRRLILVLYCLVLASLLVRVPWIVEGRTVVARRFEPLRFYLWLWESPNASGLYYAHIDHGRLILSLAAATALAGAAWFALALRRKKP